MKITSIFICCLILLFTSSCVSTHQNWKNVTDFDKRINMIGFSVMPPSAGDDWHIANKTEAEIVFSGKNRRAGSTLAAFAFIYQLPNDIKTNDDFLKFSDKYRELNSDPNRYEIMKHDEFAEEKNNVFCIQYHLLTKDKNAYTSSGYKKMVLEIYGVTCRHPDNQSYAVDMSFSEKYEEKNQPPDLEEKAMSFISTLKFEKIN